MKNVSDKVVLKNQNTHFMFNKPFAKIVPFILLYNTLHALCVLDNQGYRRILRICNTYFFSLQQWLRERASMVRYVTCTLYYMNRIIKVKVKVPLKQAMKAQTTIVYPAVYLLFTYLAAVQKKWHRLQTTITTDFRILPCKEENGFYGLPGSLVQSFILL
jgi:hypothetical protein